MDFYKIGLQRELELLEDELASVSNSIIEIGIPEGLAIVIDDCQDKLSEIIKSLREDNKNG